MSNWVGDNYFNSSLKQEQSKHNIVMLLQKQQATLRETWAGVNGNTREVNLLSTQFTWSSTKV